MWTFCTLAFTGGHCWCPLRSLRYTIIKYLHFTSAIVFHPCDLARSMILVFGHKSGMPPSIAACSSIDKWGVEISSGVSETVLVFVSPLVPSGNVTVFSSTFMILNTFALPQSIFTKHKGCYVGDRSAQFSFNDYWTFTRTMFWFHRVLLAHTCWNHVLDIHALLEVLKVDGILLFNKPQYKIITKIIPNAETTDLPPRDIQSSRLARQRNRLYKMLRITNHHQHNTKDSKTIIPPLLTQQLYQSRTHHYTFICVAIVSPSLHPRQNLSKSSKNLDRNLRQASMFFHTFEGIMYKLSEVNDYGPKRSVEKSACTTTFKIEDTSSSGQRPGEERGTLLGQRFNTNEACDRASVTIIGDPVEVVTEAENWRARLDNPQDQFLRPSPAKGKVNNKSLSHSREPSSWCSIMPSQQLVPEARRAEDDSKAKLANEFGGN
ncbi:hypothetical protein K435DRAFT_800355 [Dendrothele bispora CBS 962.96]|uniref:Uncharacterized protein n=1 Tax=Dendrothele bispora (strain CBS 962.96) TaxID=1314807 RepID=A0A4S8LSW6_DENBC|nr:hypothetical protein K435DRAFT_800355 [Dendrothele bispora CBS 962.96]